MTLTKGLVGNTYIIEAVQVGTNLERRLEALGLFAGTTIELLNKKKSGTSIFKVRGTRLAVGPDIAEGIQIKEAKTDA